MKVQFNSAQKTSNLHKKQVAFGIMSSKDAKALKVGEGIVHDNFIEYIIQSPLYKKVFGPLKRVIEVFNVSSEKRNGYLTLDEVKRSSKKA